MPNMIDDEDVILPYVWATHAQLQGEKPALICGDRVVSWNELNAAANRVANALLQRNIGVGVCVAVLMSNSVEMAGIMLGVVKSGACIVPLSTMLTSEQIGTLLADSGASLLFACEQTRDLAESAAPGRETALVASDFSGGEWLSFADFLDGAGPGEPLVRYCSSDPFNIIYSSGTTGLPKGIVHSHRARRHWSWSNAIEMRFTRDSVALITTPLYSNGTWFMFLPPLLLGATIVLMERFSAAEFLRLVEAHRVTHSFVVPAQCQMLLDEPGLGGADLSSLQTLLSAGSALRVTVRAEVEKRITPHLFELYGFSEGFASIVGPADAARKPRSVGRPILGFDVRIIDPDGKEVATGETGEIAGFGAGAMLRYHGKEAQTEELVWRDTLDRTFIRSGDVGKMDEDGFLYIMDRKKDMILSGGFNVFPADIEAVLARHEAVADNTVIGIPHPRWEEVPLALIIRREGAQVSETDLLAWANERLAKTQRLARVEFRDEFPRNALGKVVKRMLRDPFWQEVDPA